MLHCASGANHEIFPPELLRISEKRTARCWLYDEKTMSHQEKVTVDTSVWVAALVTKRSCRIELTCAPMFPPTTCHAPAASATHHVDPQVPRRAVC